MISIQQLQSNQQEALDAFKGKAWPAADAEHYGNTPPDFTRHAFTLIALEGEEIVGYSHSSTDAGVATIHSLIVHPDKKDQGIGSALLTQAEKESKLRGCHKVSLETGKEWKSRGFYEKLGYIVRTELPDHYGHQTFVLMEKKLA